MGDVYNEVSPANLGKKRKLKKNATPKPADQSQEQPGWPPSLQDFVNRSFLQSESLSDSEKTKFGAQMQLLMEMAVSQKKIWSNRWELQRLPVFDESVALDLYENVVPPRLEHSTPPPRLSGGEFDSKERKRQRMARFGDTNNSPSVRDTPTQNGIIVGTLTDLEKRYLRLTSEPDPARVRPQPVLEKCVPFVVNKYRQENSLYLYVNDQLKAIRQDLTVQHIKNDFSIHVYETHGRLALENNDLGEFNQCQSQLKHLYDAKLKKYAAYYESTFEFTCYRILYLLLTSNYSQICRMKLEILAGDVHKEPVKATHREFRTCVYEALNLLTHITQGNYHQFFKVYRLFQTTQSMSLGTHLLKQFMAPKQRLIALHTMCKAYRKIPVEYLQSELAFGDDDTFDDFAQGHKLSTFISGTEFDFAAARPTLQSIVDNGNFKRVDIKGQV